MSEVKTHLDDLISRRLAGGGFSPRPGGEECPEGTAWAALALRVHGAPGQYCQTACRALVRLQSQDGRVALYPDCPQAYWPTALAIIAWQGSALFELAQKKAVSFLLGRTGMHYPKPQDATGHDASIRGWPWIDGTHSWVPPTAMAILALRLTGLENHARVQEGVRMIMDRQLPQGGWNYGNTRVLGATLSPSPGDTGYALSAVHGLVDRSKIGASLGYLKDRMIGLKSPLALTWTSLALGAWQERPTDMDGRILNSLASQPAMMPYDTASLAGLLTALEAKHGLPDRLGKG